MSPEVYLGDGVYAYFDGYMFVLRTKDGINVTNTIYLEPTVLRALELFVEQTRHGMEATDLKDDEEPWDDCANPDSGDELPGELA